MTAGKIGRYDDELVALASMHRKERALTPVFARALGLKIVPVRGLDTDRFGTFSRDVERAGSQLDAARAKIAAAFAAMPGARFAAASDGSFGPHPAMPLLPFGRELVLLADRKTGAEVAGHDFSCKTNFAHRVCSTAEEALAFASRCRFPGHGVIVSGWTNGKADPARALMKDIPDQPTLVHVARSVIAACGAALVETDMRADRNPTRMVAIRRAAKDLVRRFANRCPHCAQPGFSVEQRIPGRPCAWCGVPTRLVLRNVFRCRACGHSDERPETEDAADPAHCEHCNP